MDLGLKGRRVLVTGGSRGIGRECALSFAREGADVCINYVNNKAAAEKTRQDLLALGVAANILQADVTDVDAARKLVDQAVATMGGIDVLVHSAGICQPTGEGIDIVKAWHLTMASHIDSTYYLCNAVAEPMKAQQWGRIIVVGSIVGRLSGASDYHVAKAGQSQYTRGMAAELAPHEITVNIVSPGRVNTDMVPGTKEDWIAFAKAEIPVYRNRDDYPGPDLIGDVVAFLASEQARYISGADLPVCGACYTGL